jgi:hypothetical protein
MPTQDQDDEVATPSYRDDVEFLMLAALVAGFVFLVVL